MLITLRNATALLILAPAALAPQSRSCMPAPHPSPLPPMDSILGPVGLRVLSAPLGVETDTVRFALHFQTDGTLLRLLPLSAGLPDSVVRQIRVQVRSRLFTDVWGLQVLLYPGDPRNLAFRASIYCGPTPPLRSAPVYEGRIMTREQARRLEARGPFRFLVELDTLGRVRRASMIQSSGDRDWDASVLERARNERYQPATLDGAPIPARYERSSDSL